MLGDTLHWVMIRDHVKSSSPISYEIHVVGKNISIEGPFLAYEFLNSHKWLSQVQPVHVHPVHVHPVHVHPVLVHPVQPAQPCRCPPGDCECYEGAGTESSTPE